MWGPRADLCEKLQGNIRLEGEYTCTWRVSAHVGAQAWKVSTYVGPRADLCEKLQGNIRLEGEYTCGGPGLISVRNYRATSGWRVSTHVGAQD